MPRYIDADKLEGELFRDGIAGIFLGYPRRIKYTIGEIRAMLKNERIAPTADVKKVRRGTWVSVEADVLFKCSICEAVVSTSWDYEDEDMFKYCPCCGAAMDGGEDVI